MNGDNPAHVPQRPQGGRLSAGGRIRNQSDTVGHIPVTGVLRIVA